jgi:perosamine synthetase
MFMDKIPYGKQWIEEDDVEAVVEVLRSDWLTQGPKVEEFEKAVAEYCGAQYAVAVSSGTAALHAAYHVAGIGEGDEVITTPLTFSATVNGVVYNGGTPVLCDIEAETLNIDPAEITKKITPKTKAIAPVDFAGHPCEYEEILKIAQEHNLLVIEDAAHALGAMYKGEKVGGIADMTIFSFHPVKAITTGEGGMVLTNNKDFYEKLKTFRHHGIVKKPEQGGWYYEIKDLGYNYRLTDIHSALGLSQLKKLDRFVNRRREIVAQYNKAFEGLDEVVVPSEKEYVRSAYHIYIIQVQANRRKVFDALQEEGIGAQVHYVPVHYHPYYQKKFGYKKGNFPVTEAYYENALTLPLFPKMTDSEVEKVIKSVWSSLKNT